VISFDRGADIRVGSDSAGRATSHNNALPLFAGMHNRKWINSLFIANSL
jgi:hypothetical protein